MKPSNVSKCCGSSISVAGSDEGTMFFVCDACHKSCDVFLPGEKPQCPYCHAEMLKGHSCPGAKEDILIKLAEQRGYERGLVEAHKNDPTGSELDDLLTRTEQEGYERG